MCSHVCAYNCSYVSCMIKIHFKAEDESEPRQNTHRHATSIASVSYGWRRALWPVSGWLFWGVVLCAQALGAPVAGWARASAERMTPAIPAEFGLYSCIWLDRNKGLRCTRGFGIQQIQGLILSDKNHAYIFTNALRLCWSVFPTLRIWENIWGDI